MKIPTFTRQKFVDDDGNLMPAYQQAFDILFQQMQLNLSDDGCVIPSKTTEQITNIASSSNANNRPNGTIWYDITTDQYKGKVNGVVKVFTLT